MLNAGIGRVSHGLRRFLMTTLPDRSDTGEQVCEPQPLSGVRDRGQVPIAYLNEPTEIPGQNQLLSHAPDWTERGRKLDPVNHRGSLRVLTKLVNVPEPPERAFDLLVDEIVRRLHLRDPARHSDRDPEMPGPPGDLFSQGDEAGCDAGDGFFP